MKLFQPAIIFIFCLCCSIKCFAQIASDKDSFNIHVFGLIINEKDEENIPYVHILNINSQKGTVSDLSGKFSIIMKKEDTLAFSAVGFENYFFTFAKKEIASNNYSIKISLNHSTLELSPVSIFAFKNEAAFKQDILDLKIEEVDKTIYIPGAFYGTPEIAKTKVYLNGGLACDGCITSLLNLFNRKSREEKKMAVQKSLIPRNEEIYKKYNPDVIKKATGLSGDDLNAFILFCKIEDDLILKANEFEILVAINECYKHFQGTEDGS